ncbi:MAG TPA: tyrosine--tRNA ligase [Bacteroidales bacterium]|nr:MAG: tyrosine--tRNA ligase [Bacteroidetes bacterium GWE2_42_24]OFY25241.1 MAG: tyrosine--tRNA ligase [Bacteroidetes bacterium GWF2_43_11]HAQ65927.1 tyrosine--tRNA ligase [Bacteroidales bacterium]HBZ66942.1 tyrosine--tRNA ligase [Bacteroidales bacterium]
MKNFVEELRWRGMIHDVMPGTEEMLQKEMVTAYVGIDPTADSLHIGHLVSIMMLRHLQRSGHRPVVLVGGATGMIGDPSGKSQERNLLDEPTLRHNQECLKGQIAHFLDFDSEAPNKAVMANNYDWMKEFSFLNFIRDVGKHITVNYMMAKDSVKKRISGENGEGMSFTEFTYQLVQGYDFLELYRTLGCRLQMGGSDQWGNITTGTEMIRRIAGGEAYALTCPLITKSDGGKFGKTEQGNIWLDPDRTSPYQFYQFWINVSDTDASKYIRIFTTRLKEAIEALEAEHAQAPHLRVLQKALAHDITCDVHSEADYIAAVEASEILFGKGTTETLHRLGEKTLLSVFDGVPRFNIAKEVLDNGCNILDLLAGQTSIFPSKGEARRTMKDGGVMINREKVAEDTVINTAQLLNGRYLLAQRGKKNYYLIIVG